MNTSLSRGRAASVSANRGRGRGRPKAGSGSPFTPHTNGQAGEFDNAWPNYKGGQQSKRGNGRKQPHRRNNALNYSLDEILPGSDDEIISQPRGKGQTLDERAARFSAHANAKKVHYEELKKLRAHEREIAIEKGLIDDPDKPRKLQDAIKFAGTCQDMCPQFERLERELQHGLDSLEKDEQGNADPAKCVKTYRRSAAGNEQELPSDVRPSPVLERTLDYLFNSVLGSNPIERCHVFVRDRTRAVRKDFGVQNIKDMDAVLAHERIARFHILSLHEMCELDEEKFSEQQETEQLRKVLVSLAQFYDDLNKVGIRSENEPEFRAYQILSYIRDQDTVRWAQTLPLPIFKHPLVQRALDFHALAQRNNEIMGTSARRNKPTNCEAAQNFFTRFFKLVADKETTFLMACMLESHFPDIRKGAMKAMNKSYHARYSGLSAETVRQMLGYDTVKDCIKEAELYGIPVDYSNSVPTLQFSTVTLKGARKQLFIEPLSNPKTKKSHLLVEPKKAGMSYSQIISSGLGGAVRIKTSSAVPIIQPPTIQSQAAQTTPYFSKSTSSTQLETVSPIPTKPIVPAVKTAPAFPAQLKAGFFARANVEAMEQIYKPSASQQSQQSDTEKLQAQKEASEMAERQLAEAKRQLEIAEKAKAEEKKRRQEAEQRRLQAENEAARAAEAERLRHLEEAKRRVEEEELAKKKADEEAQLKFLAQTRKMAIVSQLQRKLCNELLEEVLQQQVRQIAFARYFDLTRMKRVVNLWRARTQKKVSERKAEAKRLEKIRQTLSRMHVANPIVLAGLDLQEDVNKDSTPPNIPHNSTGTEYEDIEMYSQQLIRDVEQESRWRDQLWQKMDFAKYLYPGLLPANATNDMELKPQQWQLLICMESWNCQPAQWILHKFDIDATSGMKCVQHPQLDLFFKATTSDRSIDDKSLSKTGAIIFQLSEQRQQQYGDIKDSDYWTREKTRFHAYLQQLHQIMPQFRAPVLILYWPVQQNLDKDLSKLIPQLINVYNSSVVSDYRVVIMTPKNACEELPGAIEWLGECGRKPAPLIKTPKVEVAMQKLWEIMNWSMAYIYQQMSQAPNTVENTVQGLNHLVSIHNMAMKHLNSIINNGKSYDSYMLPNMKTRPFSGRTITSADLYLLHTEWISQIQLNLPKVTVPSTAQEMCHAFSIVTGTAFHEIQDQLLECKATVTSDTQFRREFELFQQEAIDILQKGVQIVKKRKYPMDGLTISNKIHIPTS